MTKTEAQEILLAMKAGLFSFYEQWDEEEELAGNGFAVKGYITEKGDERYIV